MKRIEVLLPLLLALLLLLGPSLPGVGDPQTQHREESQSAPRAGLWFGADDYGRDVFARFLAGGRWSCGVGLGAVTLSLAIAWTLGAASAMLPRAGLAILWLADLFLCLPWLYLVIAVRAALPLDLPPRATFAMLPLLLACTAWARPARLVRGKVLEIQERGYVQASRNFGHSLPAVFLKHILPATWDLAVTQGILLLPRFVLAELTLSFLGAGAAEPLASWGALVVPLKQVYLLEQQWWRLAPLLAMIPFFAVFAVCGLRLEAHSRVSR